ncbi:MAG: OprO/OprP family phosphate-selective porin [Candidatus Cloacimonetes bacterium]|nr:OprO/OprP family phosphate-selective porin [Candidatus Cloacimonadota bacterium]
MKKILFLSIFLILAFQIYAQGCMEASSDEGVNVVGYLQTQFETKLLENDNESSFTFNRARMGLVGNIPYDFSYYIMYEFSPFQGGPYLLDGFITYSRFAPYASVSIGQFKSPFSLELNTPCQGLHTINRSLVVNGLTFPARDMGLLFKGNYEKFIKYAISFTNEISATDGFRDENSNKTISGRIVVSPFDFVSLGGSYKFGTSPTDIVDADEDESKRFAIELEAKYSDFLFQAEYIRGEDIGSYTTGGG